MIDRSCLKAPRRHNFDSLLVLLATLLLFGSFTTAGAQAVGAGRDLSETGGNNVIAGRVYLPDRSAGGIHIKVTLESTSAPSISTSTNADGVFRFSGVNTGYYTVIIDAGEKYEVVRERVEFDRSANGMYAARSVQLPIYLRPKGSEPATKPGVVDSAFAGVPKPAMDLYEKAMESSQKGDNKRAADQLIKAIEIYPQFGVAQNELGVQYLKLGQPDKAAEALRSAVKTAPNEFTPHLNYGIALLNQKKFPEAETELRDAVKKNDSSPTAHMYLGIVLMSQRKLDEAQKELERAVNSNSNEVAMAHRYLGGIYWGNKEYKRAADELEIYLKLVPKAVDAERTKAAIKDLRSKQ